MVDISEALVTYLKADTSLHALVEDRFYPGHLPENRVLPAVVYFCQATPRLHVCRVARPDFRLTAWSPTHKLSWQVAEALRVALEGFHGSMGTVHAYSLVDNSYDGQFEPTAAGTSDGLYPVHVLTRIWFQEAAV